MSPDYQTHLNKYPTIFIDWNRFSAEDKSNVVEEAQKIVVADLKDSFPFLKEKNSLMSALEEIHKETGDRFVMIIDEWDMLVRDVDEKTQKNT